MFLRSDTNMLVLSALPIFPEGSPQGHDVMDLTRKVAASCARTSGSCCTARRCPTSATLDAALAAMEHTAAAYPVVAWKTFTHFPDAFEGDGNGWWLDDRDPGERQVGERFIRKAKEIGATRSASTRGCRSADRSRHPTTSARPRGAIPT